MRIMKGSSVVDTVLVGGMFLRVLSKRSIPQSISTSARFRRNAPPLRINSRPESWPSSKPSPPTPLQRRHITSTSTLRSPPNQEPPTTTPSTPSTPSTTTTTPPSKPTRPLDGITVVSLEQAIAAPFCTRQLADLGARVIKIERPGVGDFARAYDERVQGLASHFVWTNRSKESWTLDLKDPKDLGLSKKFLGKGKGVDVLVQNLAPGASDRLGLSYEKLKGDHPGLVVCDISGYGQDGPYRNKKAYDLLIQSEAGLLSVTGASATQPAKVGISIADIAAGMYAFTNIMAALMQRGKTGQGCKIDISMLESMVEWMGFPMYYSYDNAPGPSPAGASHAAIYPYGPFETGRDGRSVILGIQNEREWANLCHKVLDNPDDLATDARFSNNTLRVKNRDALKQIICNAFSNFTAEEAVARLDEANIANAAVNDMQGVWNHPQLRARGRWTDVNTSIGPIPALIPPGVPGAGAGAGAGAPAAGEQEEGVKARMDSVPALGEHNEAILAELGVVEASG